MFRKLFLNEHFILLIIILNAVALFLEESGVAVSVFRAIDYGITIMFLTEAIVKIREYSFRSYFRDNWNKLDFILVIISLPSLVFWVLNVDIDFTFLLALRVFRVFKFFRLIRFFPDIDKLAAGVRRAISSSYAVFFGFFLFIVIFAMLSCSMFKTISPEFFGTPLDSVYSIFRLFSIEGWYEIPDSVFAHLQSPTLSWVARLYFVVLLIIGGVIGLSLVNSVFVDAMVADNNDELNEEVRKLQKKIDDLNEKIDSLAGRKPGA